MAVPKTKRRLSSVRRDQGPPQDAEIGDPLSGLGEHPMSDDERAAFMENWREYDRRHPRPRR